MAISNLTVYTGNVPLIGQTQIEFDTNTGNILGYLNGFGTDLNARVGEINTVISTTNGLATAAASSAANAAISATNAGLAATRAEAVVIPTTATYSMDVINTRNTALSKAGFEAIARDNRDKFAGSGFVEFGKDTITTASDANINSGMWVRNTFVNTIYLGRENVSSSSASISKTQFPYANINGIVHNISFINDALNDKILLPQAPTVYPTGTTNHLITEGLAIAHADASNSGLIVNGKFDTDTTGWTAFLTATSSVVGGAVRVTSGATAWGYVSQTIATVVGKQYKIEATQTFGTANGYFRAMTSTPTDFGINIEGRVEGTFTATAPTTEIRLNIFGGTVGQYTDFDNIAVFPKDAISRSDLVFLESWHEDTSEKGVLYDLGNVQYKGTISAGTAGTFSGSDTYSLFGNWQEPNALVGNSISIASLTQAQLKTFVGKSENNCYYDGDKLIQVRYRVRTVGGWGDKWVNVDPNNSALVWSYSNTSSNQILPKGKMADIVCDIGSYTNSVYYPKEHTSGLAGAGIFAAGLSSGLVQTVAYEGKCFALPIALVHRRNQGAYHPVFNANGARLWEDQYTGSSVWFAPNTLALGKAENISECFSHVSQGEKGIANNGIISITGNIGTSSGRPDGLFYDQIHEGDITDLRSSAHDTNDMEVMSSVFNGAISGDERGTQSPTTSEIFQQTTSGTVATLEVKDGKMYTLGDAIQVFDMTTSTSIGRFNVTGISSNTLTVHTTFTKSANLYLIGGGTAQ